jgi:SagB-type dehydrogenase family enzyme
MEKSMKPGERGIGERFHEETKYTPEKIAGYTLDWDHAPAPFKDYDAPVVRVQLPKPEITGDPDIWRALAKRRSQRTYDTGKVMTAATLSALLWATQGETAQCGPVAFRTAPSAGALYPLETYVHARAVEGLEPGLYHFRPHAVDLEFLKRGDLSAALAHAALGQTPLESAHVTFIWSALVARSKWKYRERAYRYIYLDAGHVAENLYLAAEALGLGVCAIGAFYDDQVNGILGLDGQEETVIYMATAGRPA